MNNQRSTGKIIWVSILGIIFIFVFGYAASFGGQAYSRYQVRLNGDNTRLQDRLNADNQVAINEIRIKQTEQLIQVEKQKADIKIQEAIGIAKAQEIINATLTDKYLQHEAIQAQEKMAESPNHTTIYIPSGQNGIPLVKTVD